MVEGLVVSMVVVGGGVMWWVTHGHILTVRVDLKIPP